MVSQLLSVRNPPKQQNIPSVWSCMLMQSSVRQGRKHPAPNAIDLTTYAVDRQICRYLSVAQQQMRLIVFLPPPAFVPLLKRNIKGLLSQSVKAGAHCKIVPYPIVKNILFVVYYDIFSHCYFTFSSYFANLLI